MWSLRRAGSHALELLLSSTGAFFTFTYSLFSCTHRVCEHPLTSGFAFMSCTVGMERCIPFLFVQPLIEKVWDGLVSALLYL